MNGKDKPEDITDTDLDSVDGGGWQQGDWNDDGGIGFTQVSVTGTQPAGDVVMTGDELVGKRYIGTGALTTGGLIGKRDIGTGA